MAKFNAVSLFSNCGAGDVGYAEAGFHFRVIAELVPHRLKVALANHPGAIGVEGDLRETWKKVVSQYRSVCGQKDLPLLAACPPCQGMSSVNSGRGAKEDADAGSKDARNLLVTVIASVAKALRPKIIVVENVPVFLTRKVRHPKTNCPISAALLLRGELHKDYELYPVTLDLADYGVPQSRKRAFLTFVRRDLKGLKLLNRLQVAPFPRAVPLDERLTVKQAFAALKAPALDAASKEQAVASTFHPLHFVPVWEERQYRMVEAIPPGSGLSAWENSTCRSCGTVSENVDAAVCDMCSEPLDRPAVIDPASGGWRLIKGFRNSSYRRMRLDTPAPTITTASGHVGSSFTIHPTQNRVLSAFECAALQTFPPSFQWGDALKEVGHTNVREMIGEAVPPRFTKLHGGVLVDILRGKFRSGALAIGDRASVRASAALLST